VSRHDDRAPAAARPAIVLVRPQEEGNVGAVARAMANLDLDRLLLVEPAVACGAAARARAVGGVGILERAERHPTLDAALAGFARIAGTTSARERSGPGAVLAPRALAALLARDPPGTAAAVVFGPERSGLTAEELARCSPVVTVPCALAHPTLNLAQAVLVVAYELFVARAETAGGPGRRAAPAPPGGAGERAAVAAEPLASSAELAGLLGHAERLLRSVGFARHRGFAVVLRDLRGLLARAAPTVREVRILRGVCRRVEAALRAPRRPG
jgi:TrmH family RNA methyltransferase